MKRWWFKLRTDNSGKPRVRMVLGETWFYARQEACRVWSAGVGRVVGPEEVECVGDGR